MTEEEPVDDDGPSSLMTFIRDGVGHIRFDRPHRLNALTPLQHLRVVRAVEDAERDPSVRVVAFSGAGRAFCAGDDIAGDRFAWPEDRLNRRPQTDAGPGPILLQEVTTAIRNLGKPTVAVLHGHAIGAGYDYATSCDFRIATADCRIGDQRVHRAMWAAEGWSYKTPRLVGLSRAVEIGLLGKVLTGEQAHGSGFVHELIHPDLGDDVLKSAAGFLARLARIPTHAYATQKHRLHALLDLPDRAWDL